MAALAQLDQQHGLCPQNVAPTGLLVSCRKGHREWDAPNRGLPSRRTSRYSGYTASQWIRSGTSRDAILTGKDIV